MSTHRCMQWYSKSVNQWLFGSTHWFTHSYQPKSGWTKVKIPKNQPMRNNKIFFQIQYKKAIKDVIACFYSDLFFYYGRRIFCSQKKD